jgi:hypothetical protein
VGSFAIPESVPQGRRLVWRATIDWGDGTRPTRARVKPAADGSLDVVGRHRYLSAGQFTVSILVRLAHNPIPPVSIVGTANVDAFSGVTFTAEGGFEGVRQTVEVRPDGGFTITGPRRDSPPQEGQLSPEQRARLAAALVGWSDLQDEYGQVIFDGYIFQVTFAGKSVSVWEPARRDEAPATFVAVVRFLQRLGNAADLGLVIPLL